MKCIYCFFEPLKQKELMRISQMLEQTFENTLNRYLEFFKTSFQESLENDICSNHEIEDANGKEILKRLIEDKEEMLSFFEADVQLLKIIYTEYVNGKTQNAIEMLERLYNEVLNDDISILQENLFFRGRRGNLALTKNEMFHIPFNKRYLISNQRYSLSGIPLLYLAYTSHTVLKELSEELELDKVKDIYLSTYSLKNKIKALNFTNVGFYQYISEYLYPDMISLELDYDKLKKMIRKMNIINCFSFQRRYENQEKFCEEYVLPQLLAIVVNKQENIDAIIYSSTKDFEVTEEIFNRNEKKLDKEYKSNVAFFTKMNTEESREYDMNLFNKFCIGSPISVEKLSKEMTIKNRIPNMTLASERAEKRQFESLEKDYEYINIINKNLLFVTNCIK